MKRPVNMEGHINTSQLEDKPAVRIGKRYFNAFIERNVTDVRFFHNFASMNPIENTSDTRLLDLLKSGNMSAYEQIFSRYYPALCAYARIFVKNTDICENLIQELMLWLWENREIISIESSLSRYLFTATRNRCLKYISHEMAERRVLDEIHMKLSGQFVSPDFYIIKELEDKIQKALSELPDTYREAFEMNRFQNKTYNEIAAQLHVSPKTIDYRIQQSLKLLRIKLKDYLPILALLSVLGD